jgi:Leucine-rich repeat (LRR) protein
MKNILLFSALFIFTFGFSQTTLIPDPNFEQALIYLGYDTAPINGSVPTANISSVTNLNVNSRNISDLTGIEDFTALTNLYCDNNQLTSIDVSNNNALTSLSCNNNQLTSLDVTNNTALYLLYCDNNQLTSLDLSNNPALSNFTCTNNQLTSLDVSNNPALTYFRCKNNQLTSLDVSNNPVLELMELTDNQLTSLDVSNNTYLVNFYFGENQLTDIDLSNNTSLNGVDCRNNQLTSLDVSNNIALYRLSCLDNQLTSLDVRNGNNTNFNPGNFNSTNNPNLTCIYVDDADYSNANWTNIDPNSTFVNNEAECEALSIGDNALELDVTIYPNPTDNYLFIEGNKNPISISIYNLLGAEVITKSTTNKINVSELPKGIYIIKISDGIGQTDRKFIKN